MRKSTDTREKLLETAIGLIWQSSYAQVGINDICRKAGITKGGFYHYFPSKAALFEAACDFYWAKIQHELDSIFSPVKTAREQLDGLVSYVLTRQGADPAMPVSGCPFFTAGAQAGAEDYEIRQAAIGMAERALRYNTLLIRNLQAEGHLTAVRDPEQRARMMYHYIQGLLLYGRVHQDLAVVEHDLRVGLYDWLGVPQ